MDTLRAVKALASRRRLQILRLLKDPVANFGGNVDLLKDGVSLTAIARKLKLSQPTLTEHLGVLTAVGFVQSKRVGRFHYFLRDEERIAQAQHAIVAELQP